MPLAKITVAGQAPYPVAVDEGWVFPGESRRVTPSPLIDTHIETGAIVLVEAEEAAPAAPARKSRSEDDSPKENS